MGRVLTPERREAAIAWWRRRFLACKLGERPTASALADFTGRSLVDWSPADRERLSGARRTLWGVLAREADVQSTALDAWLATYLVDAGRHLLLDKTRRNAVLASIRDDDRQMRGRQTAIRHITLRLPEETARQLRQFARDRQLPNDGAAIKLLLDSSQPKPRRSPDTTAPRAAGPDLFASLTQQGAELPGGSSAPAPSQKRKKRLTD